MPPKGWIFFCLIVITGAALRFYGLDWGTNWQTGQFHAFHPDEKTLIDSSSLIGVNMRDIVSSYGKAPMYVLAGAARSLGWVLGLVPFEETTARFTHLVGRNISALLGTCTVVLTFLIGRHLGGQWTGLLSAFFMAVCAGHIQQSHYYTVEVFLTCWVSLSLYLALYLPANRLWIYVVFGMAMGLATGTRFVGIYLGVPFILSHFWPALETKGTSFSAFTLNSIRSRFNLPVKTWYHMGFAVLTGGAIALACEPLLVLDPVLFFSDSDVRRLLPSIQVAQGEIVRIWSLYDFSTTPFVFYLTHLLRDAMGYPLEIAALIGIILVVKQKNQTGLLLLSWLLPYFLMVGGLHTKPIRYVTPMLPGLVVLAAWACVFAGRHLRHNLPRVPVIAAWPALLIGIFAGIHGVNSMQIYGQEDRRIVASRWIETHIPKNAGVLTERGGFATEWMVSQTDYQVKTDQPNFFIDTEGYLPYSEQISILDDMLAGVDWMVVIEENRMRQFLNVPQRYPIGHAYYQKLKNGDLGFDPIATFKITPFVWQTDTEPTVTAFDHPTVVIYQRTGDVKNRLGSWREFVQQDPALPDRELFLGILAYKKGNWLQARRAFQQTTTVRPNFLLGHILFINTYIREGKIQDAERLWAQLENKVGGIPAEIGIGMMRAGLPEDGVLYLERNLAVYQKNGHVPGWIAKATAEGWWQLGSVYCEQKNFASAQQAFERAMQLAPNFAPAYVSLATLFLSQHRAQEALPMLEHAATLNLKYADTWYLLGKAYHMLGDIDKAQFYYHQAMGLRPAETRYQKAIDALSSIPESLSRLSGT